jgi:hypothetical protein
VQEVVHGLENEEKLQELDGDVKHKELLLKNGVVDNL